MWSGGMKPNCTRQGTVIQQPVTEEQSVQVCGWYAQRLRTGWEVVSCLLEIRQQNQVLMVA
jgi:hypothetical protein